MNFIKNYRRFSGSLVLILLYIISLSGCITAKKTDKFVSRIYGNRLPPLVKSTNNNIHITSAIPIHSDKTSSSIARTDQLLPLLFYWQYDYKVTCALNPAIPIHHFTNTVYSQARRVLNPKLKGHHLKLTIEQLPHIYAWDDNFHMIWPVFFYVGWERVSLQPQISDLVVSYQLLENDQVIKSGKIDIQDNERDRPVGMFEFKSWKNLTSTYIARYNHDIINMSRLFVSQLGKKL